MAAGGVDREEPVAAAREQDRIVADMPGEHLSIGEGVGRHAQRQVGTGRCGLVSAHVDLPGSDRGVSGPGDNSRSRHAIPETVSRSGRYSQPTQPS